MSTSAKPRRKIHPAIGFVLVAGLVALFVWLISFSPWKVVPFKLAGQAYMLITILLAFRYWPPMVRFVLSMPIAHRIIFGLLLGGMICGHYSLNGRNYFPFIVWEIFPLECAQDTIGCQEFIATTEDGTKVRLLAEQLVPSIVQVNPLSSLPPETARHLALALAKIYNEHHGNNPVRQVDLVVMSVKLHPPANESRAEPSCELLKHYDVSSDH